MKNLTPEMIEKAKAAKSAEELLALAKENGVEMTVDEAATYFAQLNPTSGELSDDDLDNVAGGAGGCQTFEEQGLKGGTKVRVTSADRCPVCGGNIGIWLPPLNYNEACVNCIDHRDRIIVPVAKLGVNFEII